MDSNSEQLEMVNARVTIGPEERVNESFPISIDFKWFKLSMINEDTPRQAFSPTLKCSRRR